MSAGPDVGVVCIDVSNVCKDDSLLGGMGLGRLDLVVDAWRAQISQHAEVHLVADRSLLRDLSKAESKRVRTMRRRGEMHVARDADDVLLDLAESSEGCVLSRDRFLDKRRGRRWVWERFYSWVMAEGRIRIIHRESRNTQPFDVSRKEEQKKARSRGIPTLHHPAAQRRWACVSAVPCSTREATPDLLQVLPLLEGDTALCPSCRGPLRDLGRRPAEAEMKLVIDDTAAARFTVEQGETVRFGRLTMPDSPQLLELSLDGAFADVGRAHVDLRILGRRLAVRPVDDDHPVWVRRWHSQARLFGGEQKLQHADGFSPIDLRDTLRIGKRLEVHRSGRSIAEAEALGKAGSDDIWRLRGTTK